MVVTVYNGKFVAAIIIIGFGLYGIAAFMQTAPDLSLGVFMLGWLVAFAAQSVTHYSQTWFDWWFYVWKL